MSTNLYVGPMSEIADSGARFVEQIKWARRLVSASLLILVVSGCGGDGSGTSTTADQPTSTIATNPESETTASPGTDSTAPPTGQHEGEGEGTEFCEWILGNVDDDTDFSDPVATEESMTRNLAEAEEFRSNVPDAIAADFEVVFQQMVATKAVLADNGYDLFSIPDGVLEDLATNEMVEASSNISDYCGAGL